MALDKKLANFQNALHRLTDAHNKTIEHQKDDEFSFFRDSTIQKFEFTLEIAWKSIKTFLHRYLSSTLYRTFKTLKV